MWPPWVGGQGSEGFGEQTWRIEVYRRKPRRTQITIHRDAV